MSTVTQKRARPLLSVIAAGCRSRIDECARKVRDHEAALARKTAQDIQKTQGELAVAKGELAKLQGDLAEIRDRPKEFAFSYLVNSVKSCLEEMGLNIQESIREEMTHLETSMREGTQVEMDLDSETHELVIDFKGFKGDACKQALSRLETAMAKKNVELQTVRQKDKVARAGEKSWAKSVRRNERIKTR